MAEPISGRDELDPGRWHGVRYSDGASFEGQWQGKDKDGFGVLELPSGMRLAGQFAKGEICGYGSMSDRQSCYAGMFRANKFHGVGVYHMSDGSTYEGEFRAGLPHGYGTLTAPDGSRSEGLWNGSTLLKSTDSASAVLAARACAGAAEALVEQHLAPLRKRR